MAEVVELNRFPLTGAQAESQLVNFIGSTGVVGDRMLALYDSAIDPLEASNRVSQKQHRELARVSATSSFNAGGIGDDSIYLQLPDDGRGIRIPIVEGAAPDTTINEWGDLTPAHDCGDEAAEIFSNYLNHPGLRLARKASLWLLQDVEKVADRKVAPLHIVTTASMEELRRMASDNSLTASRFRPNIVVATDEEPFAENDWVGQTIMINQTPVLISRATQRCPVPGFDQKTGENKKDVPKLYPQLAKIDNKAIFGVYGYPQLASPELGLVTVGSQVYLPESARATI